VAVESAFERIPFAPRTVRPTGITGLAIPVGDPPVGPPFSRPSRLEIDSNRLDGGGNTIGATR